MASQKNRTYYKRSDSRQQIRNFTWNTDTATVYPTFNFDAVIRMVESDPVARGAVNHFVDKCMEGDYAYINKQSRQLYRAFELTAESKYKFRSEVIAKSFRQGKLFNNVFIEIVRDTDGKVKSLNTLDTFVIEPITDTNGDPIKYRSRVPNQKTGQYAEWDKKDIVWIKFGDRSIGYAPVDMKALWENLLSKEYVTRYVAWLWKTGQYRVLYNFKQASDQSIKDWLSYNKRHDGNYKAPFILKGEMETKILRDIKETESIERLLKYYDSQTLILLRVPPIDAGIPDASGRSNADAQSNNFNSHITAYKKQLEDAINHDLFPKMNKGNTWVRFAPNDRFAEEQVFKNLQIMQSMGFTNEAMEEYLADRGMFYATKVFKDPEDMMIPTSDNPRNLDTMPSRTTKSSGTANERIGTGKQSTTKESQL